MARRTCLPEKAPPGRVGWDHPSAQTPPEFAVYLRLLKTLARTSPNADRSPLQGVPASDSHSHAKLALYPRPA